jgi:hypothetical protein
MNIKTACSMQDAPEAVAADIKSKMTGIDPKALIYFASSKYNADAIGAAMQSAYGAAVPAFGCTTAGEITSGKMLENAVVAMALNSNIIEDLKIAVLQNIQKEPREAVDKALSTLEGHFNAKISDLDPEKYVGIILIDGLSGAEEAIMDQIGNRTDVSFIGGSAGDDAHFIKTHVFAEGKAYSNAAIMVLIKAATPFEFIKTESFQDLNKKLVATKVNAARREVLSFNGQPAVEAYAEAVGASADTVANFFMTNPVGLIADDHPFVRSPQQVDGTSILFYCNILEGMELSLLKSGDIVADTRKAIEDKLKAFGPISGLINFNCILRTLELKHRNATEEYGQVFKDIPTIGFSTYGEEFLGHINQTATMLLFK